MSNSKINYGGKGKKPLFENKPKKAKIEYPGDPDIEVDAKVELTELQLKFRESAKKEAELKKMNVSSEYWSCIVFRNKAQRDAFYERLGMRAEDAQYINGERLIKALELAIEIQEKRMPGKFKVNKDILALSMKP